MAYDMGMYMRSRGVTMVAGVLLIGLLGLVATVLENQGTPRSTQLAQTNLPSWVNAQGIQTTASPTAPPTAPATPADPKGASKDNGCTAEMKDPFTGEMKKVGKECWPSILGGNSAEHNCKAAISVPPGKCKVHFCDVSGKNCGVATKDTIPAGAISESGNAAVPYLSTYQQYQQIQYSGLGSIFAGSWDGSSNGIGNNTFGGQDFSSSGWHDTVSATPGQQDAPYIPVTKDPTTEYLNDLANNQAEYAKANPDATPQQIVDNTFKQPVTYHRYCFSDGAGGEDCVTSLDSLPSANPVSHTKTQEIGERTNAVDDLGKTRGIGSRTNNEEKDPNTRFIAPDQESREIAEANGYKCESTENGVECFAIKKSTTSDTDKAIKEYLEKNKDKLIPTETWRSDTGKKDPDKQKNPDKPDTTGGKQDPTGGSQQGQGSGLGNMLGSLLSGLGKALGGNNNNCGTSGQQQQQAYTYQTEITYVQDAYGQTIPIQRQVPVAVQQPSSQQCQQQSSNTSGTSANQCSPSYYCSGNDLMYRANTCGTQLVQTCQYGCSGVSCIPQGGTSGTGSAQIACSPSTADPGAIVAISFACTNNATSTGVGFDTGGASSGSAQAITATSSTASNATYTLSCTAGGVTQSSSCTVTLNHPNIMVAATPKKVESGGIASIGWISTGMSSCSISSVDLPDFTVANKDIHSVSGLATTTALYASSTIDVSCTTLGGGTRSASVTIEVE